MHPIGGYASPLYVCYLMLIRGSKIEIDVFWVEEHP